MLSETISNFARNFPIGEVNPSGQNQQNGTCDSHLIPPPKKHRAEAKPINRLKKSDVSWREIKRVTTRFIKLSLSSPQDFKNLSFASQKSFSSNQRFCCSCPSDLKK
jgi:hypothetical protein